MTAVREGEAAPRSSRVTWPLWSKTESAPSRGAGGPAQCDSKFHETRSSPRESRVKVAWLKPVPTLRQPTRRAPLTSAIHVPQGKDTGCQPDPVQGFDHKRERLGHDPASRVRALVGGAPRRTPCTHPPTATAKAVQDLSR